LSPDDGLVYLRITSPVVEATIGELGLLLSLGRDSLGLSKDVFGFSGKFRSGALLNSASVVAEYIRGVKGNAGCDPDAIANANGERSWTLLVR
jgi:hypothetical protein